jgi:hypothetical protein
MIAPEPGRVLARGGQEGDGMRCWTADGACRSVKVLRERVMESERSAVACSQ